MSDRSARWATALLIIVNGGLGAAVVLELTGTFAIAPQLTAAQPRSPELDWAHETPVFEPPSREQLDEIAARPLFSASRRPFVAAEPEAAVSPAVTPLQRLELIGVLLTDQQRVALLQPQHGAPGWAREDEMVAGWRLAKIERTRVHVAAGDRLEIVELRADAVASADRGWIGNAERPLEGANEGAAAEETDESGAKPIDVETVRGNRR